MLTVNGSIVNGNEENMLFTYSEEERDKNRINEENASHIFKPLFIPFYPKIKTAYNLNDTATLLYGFINFYLTNSSGRFYFTNEHLAFMLGVSEKTASLAINDLASKKLINTSYRIRSGGGKTRFVTLTKDTVPTLQNVKSHITKGNDNNNKINNNKINTYTHTKKILTNEDKQDLVNTLKVSEDLVNNTYQKLLDYVESTGKKYANYKATVRNWIKRDIESGKIKREQPVQIFKAGEKWSSKL